MKVAARQRYLGDIPLPSANAVDYERQRFRAAGAGRSGPGMSIPRLHVRAGAAQRAFVPVVLHPRPLQPLEALLYVLPDRLRVLNASWRRLRRPRSGHREPGPHRQSGQRHRNEEADPAPARTNARLIHSSNLRS